MKAASLITPKDSILIASGTTMHALARSIVPADELTVITASMEVIEYPGKRKEHLYYSTRRHIAASSLSVVGNMQKTYWQTFRAASCLSA